MATMDENQWPLLAEPPPTPIVFVLELVLNEYEKTENQAKKKFLLIHDGRFAYCCLFYARFSVAFAFGFIIMSLQ